MVEMVMYAAALVLVVGTVVALLVWVVRANSQVHVRNELVAGMDHGLALLGNEIREAQSVYTPTTALSQLSLETRNKAPSGETSTYIDFFLCGTRLCVKREFQAPQALTPESIAMQSLEFTLVKTGPAPSVHIVAEAEYAGALHRAQTTVSLRNYE